MRAITMLVAALVLAPGVASAHAILSKTSLGGEPVKANVTTPVTLQFNSRIEPRFTKVVLVSAASDERALEVEPGDVPGAVRVTLPPLTPGPYGLRYKVLAADGHVTESILRFKVTAAE